MSISTIRAIIKNLQINRKCYETAWKRTCVYIVLMHGEEESLNGWRLSKDHSWSIADYTCVSDSENLKKQIHKQHLHHHMLFGRVSRVWEGPSKNKLQHIQLSDTTGTSNGTGFYGQLKQKN